MYVLGGPWKLSGRFRCVSVIRVSVTFPLRFRYVSATFPWNVSATFPSRFCRVSVAFPFAFPLRFRWASACPTETIPETRPAPWCCWARAAGQIRSQSCFGTVAPTSSLNLRSRVRPRGSTFSGASADMLPGAPGLGIRCGAGSERKHVARLMVSASAVCWAVHPCFLLPQLMGKDLPSAPLASRKKPLVLFVLNMLCALSRLMGMNFVVI